MAWLYLCKTTWITNEDLTIYFFFFINLNVQFVLIFLQMLDKSGLVTIITEIDNEHFGTKGKLSGQVTENIQLI